MEKNVISFKASSYEKQYKSYYSNIENYNRARCMVGSPPVSMITFKCKIS